MVPSRYGWRHRLHDELCNSQHGQCAEDLSSGVQGQALPLHRLVRERIWPERRSAQGLHSDVRDLLRVHHDRYVVVARTRQMKQERIQTCRAHVKLNRPISNARLKIVRTSAYAAVPNYGVATGFFFRNLRRNALLSSEKNNKSWRITGECLIGNGRCPPKVNFVAKKQAEACVCVALS